MKTLNEYRSLFRAKIGHAGNVLRESSRESHRHRKRLERVKKFIAQNGFLIAGWILFMCFASVLRFFQIEGMILLQQQKSALQITVFSESDLTSDQYILIEDRLKSLDGIRAIETISPDQSIRRLLADPNLEIDRKALAEMEKEFSSKELLLPWSYLISFDRWDEAFLVETLDRIRNIEVGGAKKRAVKEAFVDQERWQLVASLAPYVKWLKIMAGLVLAYLAVYFLASIKRMGRYWHLFKQPQEIILNWKDHSDIWLEIVLLFLLGLLTTLVSHALFIGSLYAVSEQGNELWKIHLFQFFLVKAAITIVGTLVAFERYLHREKHSAAHAPHHP